MVANSIISAQEFAHAVEGLGCADKIAIAVSGGADSMALLLLINSWAKEKNIKLAALTVNHNLRKEAEDEAQQVKLWCNDLQIEHHILQWEHTQKPTTSIQEKARNARYLLMTDFCQKHYISNLFVAHHSGDQAETFFFRLARGSGLLGLSAMAQETIINHVKIIRPLLAFSKSRLLATLKETNQEWIEDPSNHNEDYTRVRIRKQLENFPNSSEIFDRVLALTTKFGNFRKHLESYIEQQLSDNTEIYSQDGYAILHKEIFFSEELLAYLIKKLSTKPKQTRSEKIKKLQQSLMQDNFKKASLSGLIFEKQYDDTIIIYNEKNKPSIIRTLKKNT